MKLITALILIFTSAFLSAQTFTGAGGPILDDGSHNYYYLSVSGLTPSVIDTNFGLETVCINLEHTWDDDLVISLIAPDGTEFELSSRNGGDGDDYLNTCFNNTALTPIYLAGAPFTGTFRPEGFMSAVNNSQNPNGDWILHIHDTWAWADAGTLFNWSLTFGTDPATPFPFSAANLPLVVINTGGKVIQDEPKIMANMKVIDNGAGVPNHPDDIPNIYNGWIGIELRGASSLSMPKKTFTVETRNANGSSLNVPLLGMPENDDWVLISNYADKSLLRNYYSYRLFRKMGHWAPRMEFCEVMIDGEYQGIYLLGEKIKRGPHRVDIHALSPADTLGDSLTGGYIFKLDWEDPGDISWTSDFPAINAGSNLKYLFDYPKSENIKPQHISYIKSYMDGFEHAMQSANFADTVNGYRKYINEATFIDYIILLEYTKNLDGYRLSTFFHKDRNEKICAGPPWDYDLAWGNGNFMEAALPTGWNFVVQANYTDQCPFWWSRFWQDTLFQNRLQCRWHELKENVLDPLKVKSEIDSLADVLSVSIDLNFTKWPILGVWVWPNPDPIPQDYEGEIWKLKDWADLRTVWLDNHWPGVCNNTSSIGDEIISGRDLMIYPNPGKGPFTVYINSPNPAGSIEILDITGKVIFKDAVHGNIKMLTLEAAPGLYFLRYFSSKSSVTKQLIIGN
ncbi:MAG: CotH kinase family protein [Bacteroidales bacterium]